MRKGPGKIAGFSLKHVFKKPATISYPFGKLQLEENYRGKIEYDAESCIGCNICARDCPAGAIKVVNVGTKEEKSFQCRLDVGHCIFCAQCVDSCPKKCLRFSPHIDLAAFSRDSLKVTM